MREARAYVLDKYCPPDTFLNRMKRRLYFFRIHRQFAGLEYENKNFSAAANEAIKSIRELPCTLICWMILFKSLAKLLMQKIRKGGE
jgi:hypothetical protein